MSLLFIFWSWREDLLTSVKLFTKSELHSTTSLVCLLCFFLANDTYEQINFSKLEPYILTNLVWFTNKWLLWASCFNESHQRLTSCQLTHWINIWLTFWTAGYCYFQWCLEIKLVLCTWGLCKLNYYHYLLVVQMTRCC